MKLKHSPYHLTGHMTAPLNRFPELLCHPAAYTTFPDLNGKPWKHTSGFFFVSKKDSSLRPCIDFHGLNNITVKKKYPDSD